MSTTLPAQRIQRLSVIIPVLGPTPWDQVPERGLAERAVTSVLSQSDPVGTEVVLVVEASAGDSLREAFRDELTQTGTRLELITPTPDGPSGDRARLWNIGAARSRGSFLAFLDPRDQWKPNRLTLLEPWLKKHDLLTNSRTAPHATSDWVRAFLAENWAIPSSLVVRRSLFEAVGGFPEGYTGLPLPRRLPGEVEYEFLLRALTVLLKSDHRDRFEVMTEETVALGERPAGFPAPIESKISRLREAVTLLSVTPKLPPRYWSAVVKKVFRR